MKKPRPKRIISLPDGIPGNIPATDPTMKPRITRYVCFGYLVIRFSSNLLNKITPTPTPAASGKSFRISNIFKAFSISSYIPRIRNRWEMLIPGSINAMAAIPPTIRNMAELN